MSLDLKIWKKPGGKLLTFGIVLLMLMLLFGMTPVVWILTGRQSESYPELVFLFLGAPLAALITLVATIRFVVKVKKYNTINCQRNT
jgi:hypothetical protein